MLLRIRDALRRRSTLNGKNTKNTNDEKTLVVKPAKNVVTPSAAAAVFKTPELLELVLAHLDQEELLKAQRVCRRWKDVIAASTLLRRILYLAPTTKIEEHIPVDNVWLKNRFPDLGIYLLQGNPKWRPKYVEALAPADFERLGTEFFAEPDASWRNMLLTQPPVKEIVVYSNIEDSNKPSPKKNRRSLLSRPAAEEEETRQPSVPSMEEIIKASVTVKSKTGVTMGMVIDAGIEARRRGSAAAKRRMSDRKDSGYVSLEESQVDEIEVSVVEIVD